MHYGGGSKHVWVPEKFTGHVHFKEHFRCHRLNRETSLLLCARFQANLEVFTKWKKEIKRSRIYQEANKTWRWFTNSRNTSPFCQIHASRINFGPNNINAKISAYASAEDTSISPKQCKKLTLSAERWNQINWRLSRESTIKQNGEQVRRKATTS